MPYIMVLLLVLLGPNLPYIIYKCLLTNIVYHCAQSLNYNQIQMHCFLLPFLCPCFLLLWFLIWFCVHCTPKNAGLQTLWFHWFYPIRSSWFGKNTVWSPPLCSCDQIHYPSNRNIKDVYDSSMHRAQFQDSSPPGLIWRGNF
jgi:hypothetical protein